MSEHTFSPSTYWEKRLNGRFGLDGVGHAGMGRSYNEWLYRIRKHVFNKALCRLDAPLAGKHVLDIGSGTGFYIDLWKQAGTGRIEGADITEVAVHRLSQAYPACRFHRLDIGDPLSDALNEPYDVVSAMDVLFHIVDDGRYERAIHNISDLLAPGGYFIWSDNFIDAPAKRSKHIVQRPLYETRSVLQDAGFSVVSKRPTFVLMSQPVDETSRVRRKLWSYIVRIAKRGEWGGMLIGGLLYPLERLLVSLVSETPATEIMVCRKVR